uniref:Uncharacterized protein n=1 Tax=Rhizophora mucronata TaxID=61149 RepID=A0A2P2J7S2_RHIMU
MATYVHMMSANINFISILFPEGTIQKEVVIKAYQTILCIFNEAQTKETKGMNSGLVHLVAFFSYPKESKIE